MTKTWTVPALALLCLLATAPPTAAHGAAPAAEYMTRLLADHNDDWFGTQDGHNLIALDGMVAYNASLGGDVLVLRLVLDGGYAAAGSTNPVLAEHVTFTAAGAAQELAFTTADNAVFSGDFDAVRGPYPQLDAGGAPDGERFYVEGLVLLASLGLAPGMPVTDLFVEGHAGDADADAMPQGVAPGVPDPTCDPGGLPMMDCVAFDIGTWTLPDPAELVTVAPMPAVVLEPGVASTLDINITNPLAGTAQTFRVRADGNEALVAFTGDAGPIAVTDVAVAGGQGARLSLRVVAAGVSDGNVTLEVTSSLGARRLVVVPVEVRDAATTPTGPVTTASPVSPTGAPTLGNTESSSTSTDKGTPGPGLLVGLLALGAAVLARRR